MHNLNFNHCKEILIKNEDRIILAIGFVLVAILSFGAGKLSEVHRGETPIIFQNAPECGKSSAGLSASPNPDKPQGQIIGNKNSLIYHVPGGAFYDKVSQANRVYFDSEEAAQKAGYHKAKN